MNPDQRLSTVISLVMILATATLGWISLNDRGVPHVADTRSLAQVPADEQNVVARLWEDPLQAVQAEVLKHPPSSAGAPNSAGDGKQTREGEKRTAGPADMRHTVQSMEQAVTERAVSRKICLLVVPIPDTPFPDDLETRLRLRYSIQMALAEENYAPDNRNYLGYFKLPSLDRSRPDAADEGAFVPYEWFLPRDPKTFLAVLVLWLPERLLGKAPLDVLTDLRTSLLKVPSCKKDDKLAGLFIIGPRTSDTLKKMVPESGKTDPHQKVHCEALQDRLAIFSPQATTPDKLIGLDAREKWEEARGHFVKKLHDALADPPAETGAGSSWCYFYNFIAPDDQLTDLLVLEMRLRGVKFDLTNNGGKDADKILVLAEADTAYGRSLPVALQASVASLRADGIKYDPPKKSTSSTPGKIQPGRIYEPQMLVYRYLRGLDQQKGLQQNVGRQAAKSGAKSAEDALAEVLSKHGAMPLGESQLDYADRLADEIKSGPDSRHIRAVGVLGADIYDKMILLRSLRSRFPDAVFFTTDLDARLWHDDHLPFTRNMIVASAYGVDVSETGTDKSPGDVLSSKTIAPFRDGYQVAVFRAGRAALRKLSSPAGPVPPAKQPLIFEIGRNGAVLLPLATRDPLGMLADLWIALAGQIQADPQPGWSFLIEGLVMAGLLWLANVWVKEGSGEKVRSLVFLKVKMGWPVSILGSIILLVLAYLTFKGLGWQPNGEPWAWNLGISIWPTELIRLLIVCSIITTLFWAWHHHLQARGELIKNYFPGDTLVPDAGRLAGLKALFRPWSDLTDQQAATIDAKKIYKVFMDKADWWCRVARVSLATLAYMLVASGAMLLFEGALPALSHIRGDLARTLDKTIMNLSVIGFLFLVFYVLDAVRLSSQLLTEICGRDTTWNATLLQQKRAEYGVKDIDLSGYIDVSFAAEKSAETGQLIFLPFIIQFLFILSRNSYFDNWTWPGTLIAIFVSNKLLACCAWIILRRAACKIREEAVKKLWQTIHETKLEIERAKRPTAPQGGGIPPVPTPEERHQGLLRLQEVIDEEHRGAYAKFFQDPALIAMLLPTGLFGILTVLFRALFGAM